MKKKTVGRWVLLVVIACFLLVQISAPAMAAAPYQTGTEGPGGMIVGTQTAYEPDGMIRLDVNQPADLFHDEPTGKLYIADPGNARIVVYEENNAPQTIGEDVLSNPSGVYVAADRLVYVADYGLKQIVVFDEQGKLVKQFGRPEEPIYGEKNDFAPKKVAVDKRGNIYVISEGSINGVVQLNNEGQFLGYVGANRTSLSMKMLIQRFIFTEGQKAQLFKSTPPSPTSIVLDYQGLLYTVTNGISSDGIKKLNIVGDNILSSNSWTSDSMVDIDVDAGGNIYTVDVNGLICVYDSFGNLLFMFGGGDDKYERQGLFKSASAIDVTDSGRTLYVADKERNVINRYSITPFGTKVYEGVDQYKQGLYVQSEDIWKEILKMNSYFILSYNSLAESYFKQNQNGKALESFRMAEDKEGYSDAFWKIRNDWLQQNINVVVYTVFAIIVASYVIRTLHRRYRVLQPFVRLRNRLAEIKLVKEIGFMFYFLKHPIDAVQELKERKRATVRSATVLYVWLLLLQVILVYAKGYLFASGDPDQMDLLPIMLTTAVPLLFWVVMNYMVSTISDGEGKLSEVYIGTVYALSPYLIFALPIALISNVLTYNEKFVYDYSMMLIQGWSLLLVCIMVKELHDYTFRQTVRNLFLTVFGIVLAALVIFLLVLLFNQEVEFIQTIIQEMRNRA
ncbi:Yip1 domain-containing protein [Paenibacillus sp. cl141a]|uniref:YIP1 family protein n=1 Tax=Paenibacillus sp. cl141a TaxID=1761877 RepID=UPI0008BD0126|nr:YIP1 family protein [Paenibacillus sp. cl141a]SEM51544.1 Yip1 domain-containing protein [Paenibacillus sp. cl141a]